MFKYLITKSSGVVMRNVGYLTINSLRNLLVSNCCSLTKFVFVKEENT
jgi:hypothetical protein